MCGKCPTHFPEQHTPDAMSLHGGRDEGAVSSSDALQEHQLTHEAEPQRPT